MKPMGVTNVTATATVGTVQPAGVSEHHHHDESTPDHVDSGSSEPQKRTGCAWCAACCMNMALLVASAALPEHFAGGRTVFSPLVVAPPGRLPAGWDRPPRA